ncbi:MAG: leucine-rich repeat domain-containing protein [Clostridia bacterium]|nr:leucine-rich repeat domain-containing protein [Clostridia bacterium]
MKKVWIFCFLCLTLVFLASSCSGHKHEYGDWVSVKKLTCTQDGLQERYCYCLEKEEKVIPAEGHKPSEVKNCGEQQRCTVCYEVLQDKKPHAFGAFTVSKQPTCAEKGEKVSVCADCGEKQTQTIYPTGHTYGDWTVAKPVTCTEDGMEERTCVCGAKDKKTIFSNGHQFGDWSTVKEASCTEDGSRERQCVCGKKETEKISAFHPYREVVIKEPTRGETGLKELTCPVCLHKTEAIIPMIVSNGLSYTVNSDGETCTIKGPGTCTDVNIVIPATIDGYRVTAIGSFAFGNSPDVIEIVIPDTVIWIGDYAFRGCRIRELIIPDSVVSVGNNIALQCAELAHVVLGDGLTSLPRIGGRNSLKSIVIGNGITSIDALFFSEFKTLESVTLPTGLTHIGERAFEYCEKLNAIILPEGLTEIGYAAFLGCESLKTLMIPSTVTNIGERAFFSCRALTSVTISPCVTTLPVALFAGCTALEEVVLSPGITYIDRDVFDQCYRFKSIRFEGTVEEWSHISKSAEWNANTYIETVVCTDGEVRV